MAETRKLAAILVSDVVGWRPLIGSPAKTTYCSTPSTVM